MTQNKFKDLERKWYAKLKKKGFLDIENTENPNRPLRDWHSLKCTSAKFTIIQANRTQYQKSIDDFINHPDFLMACKSMTEHGNSRFTVSQIQKIWELHTQGLTTRKIAREVGRVKSRIDDVLKGLRTWMKLL